MKPQRAKQWQLRLSRGCALCLVSSACGRSELDGLAPVVRTGSDAGTSATGGHSSYDSSLPVVGGSSSNPRPTGGSGATGGFVYCPQDIPGEGTSCSSSLQCAYISSDKGCCQEAATAVCKQGHWSVAFTDCDCSSAGGSGSVGGAAATGGLSGTGGHNTAAGNGNTAGALGCRGDPMAGVAPSCDLLIPTAPPLVRLESVVTSSPNAMGLARATDDARCVSVATSQSGSANEPARLRGLSFEPWSNWPKTGSLGPLTTIALPAGLAGAFTLGPALDHRVALAYQSASGETGFAWDLDPESFVGSYRYLSSARPPLAISTSSIGELLASRASQQQTMRIWSHDDSANTLFPSACADTSTSLGIEPYQQGFLWAASNGSNNTEGGCSYSTQTPGAATRIEIGQISEVCCSHSIWNFDFGTTVMALETATHPNGIWIVWQAMAADKRVLRWMRIGFSPAIVLGPASVSFDSDSPGAFAAAAVGSKLAVAWRNGDIEPRLALALIDETGKLVRSDPPVAPPDLNHLTMVSGPAGAGVLIGFADGNLMRLDCAQWE